MPIFLSVKGPVKSAQRAASRHGLNAQCREGNRKFGTVQCKASCVAYGKVVRWYGDREKSKKGRGFPPGALLYYTSDGCGTGLSGAKRKKRRR